MKKGEEQLQAKCYQWFHNEFPEERKMLFHVDNNSYNDIIGAHKKALGVNPGVSDLIYILPEARICFLETKVPGGTQSEDQKIFEQKVTDRGFLYLIYTTFEEFKSIIDTLQNG